MSAAGHLTRENPAARKGDITPHTYTINQYINKINLPKSDLDITSKKLHLNKSFTISIKDRTDAINFIDLINTDDITIYTDGSGLNDKLGYGYHISTKTKPKSQRAVADCQTSAQFFKQKLRQYQQLAPNSKNSI